VESLFDPGVRMVQPIEASEVLEVLSHREAEVEPGRLGHDRDALADRHAVLGLSGIPATVAEPMSARSRCRVCGRCGLACTVRTEKPEDLAVVHLEGHLGESGPLAEALGQLRDDQGGLGLVASRAPAPVEPRASTSFGDEPCRAPACR